MFRFHRSIIEKTQIFKPKKRIEVATYKYNNFLLCIYHCSSNFAISKNQADNLNNNGSIFVHC